MGVTGVVWTVYGLLWMGSDMNWCDVIFIWYVVIYVWYESDVSGVNVTWPDTNMMRYQTYMTSDMEVMWTWFGVMSYESDVTWYGGNVTVMRDARPNHMIWIWYDIIVVVFKAQSHYRKWDLRCPNMEKKLRCVVPSCVKIRKKMDQSHFKTVLRDICEDGASCRRIICAYRRLSANVRGTMFATNRRR